MNKEIKESSKSVFFGLEKGEKRIIKVLGENGFLNIIEIDKHMQKENYSNPSFERHGISKRLHGTNYFSGLIQTDLVNKFIINGKESKYGLTLKGILVAMEVIDFKKIAQIKQFRKFLSKNTKDKQIVKWSLDFIKAEIALVLYHNFMCGTNWSRFLYLETYWNEFKEYDQDIFNKFFFDTIFEEDSHYNYIKNKFLEYFYLLDSTTIKIPCYFNSPYREHPIEFGDSVRKYVDRWYKLVIMFEIKKKKLYSKFVEYDEMPDFDLERLQPIWRIPMRNAQKLLETHQEKIKKQSV